MENKMQTETMRLAYETPCVELLSWESDVLMSSPDIGTEYPGDWD